MSELPNSDVILVKMLEVIEQHQEPGHNQQVKLWSNGKISIYLARGNDFSLYLKSSKIGSGFAESAPLLKWRMGWIYQPGWIKNTQKFLEQIGELQEAK